MFCSRMKSVVALLATLGLLAVAGIAEGQDNMNINIITPINTTLFDPCEEEEVYFSGDILYNY